MYKNEIEQYIREAGQDVGKDFAPVDRDLADDVIRRAKQKFLARESRVWWLGLKYPTHTIVPSEGTPIPDVLPTVEEKYWFIGEPNNSSVPMPVYAFTAEEMEEARMNSPYFEYYILDPAMTWLVVETDHNEFRIVFPTSESAAGA